MEPNDYLVGGNWKVKETIVEYNEVYEMDATIKASRNSLRGEYVVDGKNIPYFFMDINLSRTNASNAYRRT